MYSSKISVHRRPAVVFFFTLFSASVLLASSSWADYSQNPGAQEFVNRVVDEHGLEREGVITLLASAQRQQSIIDAISRPAEKAKPWFEYRGIFLTERRIREGREFFAMHRETLAKAQARTGVPAEIIVAILGVETYYGRIAGSYRVLDALATLAFDYPRRSKFFTQELENFLLLTQEQGLDPLVLKGSYAGAMGYGQFMPSSYRNYAVDFDEDGVADIWNNVEDAIGSVANYLAKHGWRAGEPIVSAASASASLDPELFKGGLKPSHTIEELASEGLEPTQALLVGELGTPLRFELSDGEEYWIGLHNLYVITRYNHSSMYAMSVFQLSQEIARAPLS